MNLSGTDSRVYSPSACSASSFWKSGMAYLRKLSSSILFSSQEANNILPHFLVPATSFPRNNKESISQNYPFFLPSLGSDTSVGSTGQSLS